MIKLDGSNFFPLLSQYTEILCIRFYALDPEFGKGLSFLPRPAQARVAPAQGENGASPLRKIRERQKMGLRGSDQNG